MSGLASRGPPDLAELAGHPWSWGGQIRPPQNQGSWIWSPPAWPSKKLRWLRPAKGDQLS